MSLYQKIFGAGKLRENYRELKRKVLDSELMLSHVLDHINEGFLIVDNDFVYTYVNQKLCELVGKKPEELIGKNMWEVFPDAVNTTTYKALLRAREEKQFISNEDYYPPLDLWQENSIYPSSGGLSVFIRDISARKRAELARDRNEKIHKAIASNIPGSVIILFDRDLKLLFAEGDVLPRLGYNKEDLVGKKLTEVTEARRQEFLISNLQKAWQGNIQESETTVGGLNFLYRFVPLRDESENIFCVMLVGIDITELKQAQDKIVQYNLELEKTVEERTAELATINKELESFSYSIAHDLKSPLRAVSGYTEMLEEYLGGNADEETKKCLHRLSHNAAKMSRLIDDLLAFSKLGRNQIRTTQIDTRGLIDEVISNLEFSNEKVNISVGELVPCQGDYNLLAQVWTNLLSNALKYSSKKSRQEIQIGMKSANDHFEFFIRDNGVGFSKSSASRLFGVFQRLHREEDFPGNGIGLASAARIIHRHGGKIWAESEPEQGATFFFSLPDKPST